MVILPLVQLLGGAGTHTLMSIVRAGAIQPEDSGAEEGQGAYPVFGAAP